MAKISMLVSEDALAEIDAQAAGNRTAFMVEAALVRARALRRREIDREIARTIEQSATMLDEENAAWEATLADGLV